jgi:hypothetical protein
MQPAAYLALLSVTGGLPAFQCQPERIAALIRKLDAYRFAQREQAAKELVHIGAPAVPLLKKAVEEGPTTEIKQRAESIIREIYRRSATGGPITDGLRAALRLEGYRFPAGTDIALELEVTNLVREQRLLAAPVRWRYCVAEHTARDELEALTAADEGRIILRPLGGARPRTAEGFFATADFYQREVTALREGQAVTWRLSLDEPGRSLPPGEYELFLELNLTPLKASGARALVTNKVRFTIAGKAK